VETTYDVQISTDPTFSNAADTAYDSYNPDNPTYNGSATSVNVPVYALSDSSHSYHSYIYYGVPHYYWRVEVNNSTFVNGPAFFKTWAHEYPEPSFTVSPLSNILVNNAAPFSFTDTSTCYYVDSKGISYSYPCSCHNLDGSPFTNSYVCPPVNTYAWFFGDSSDVNNASDMYHTAKGDTSHSYNSIGTKTVTLNVCDGSLSDPSDPSAGCCSVYNTLQVQTPLNVPEWKEVSPF
jgi:hypothetical protein